MRGLYIYITWSPLVYQIQDIGTHRYRKTGQKKQRKNGSAHAQKRFITSRLILCADHVILAAYSEAPLTVARLLEGGAALQLVPFQPALYLRVVQRQSVWDQHEVGGEAYLFAAWEQMGLG